MGPSVREIIGRVEAGDRVSPAQMRAAMMILHDCYETVVSTMLDASRRDSMVYDKYLDIIRTLFANEHILRDDLSPAYSAIRLSKRIGEISSERT